jgi:hypothetical protein
MNMVERWTKPLPDEKYYIDQQVEAHSVLRLHNRQAPPPLQGEQLDQYERRLTYEVQKVAPNFKELNLYETRGDAFKLLKKQVYADAQQEARRPTQIEPGTLKEVTSYDAAGRPSYSYYGSPSAWMSDFAAPRKSLAGIYAPGLDFKKV